MLEIGKYYQQRNGVVIGPLKEYSGWLRNEGFTFCCDGKSANHAWREDGSFSLNKKPQVAIRHYF